MSEGFSSGFNQGTQEQLGVQSSQLANALQIAAQINQQRQAEHNDQMAQLQSQLEQRRVAVQEQNAQTQENYRKDSVDRQKALDLENETQKALDFAQKAMDVGGAPVGVALAHLKSINPDVYNEVARVGIGAYNTQRQAKWQAVQQAPQQPQPPNPADQTQGSPMLPQATAPQVSPSPAGIALPPTDTGTAFGLPMMAGTAPQGPAPGPDIGQAMGLPMISGQGMAAPAPQQQPMIPPQPAPTGAQGVALPGVVPGAPEQYTPATEADYLASQSPAYLAAREKERLKADADATRARAAQLRAELEKPRLEANVARAQAAVTRSQTEQEALRQRLGTRFADMTQILMDRNAINKERVEDLGKWHQGELQIAQQNANTNRQNANSLATSRAQSVKSGNQLVGIWQKFDTDARQYETRAIDLGKLADKAKQDAELYRAGTDNAQSAADAAATDPNTSDANRKMLADKAFNTVLQYGQVKKRADALQQQADDAKEVSKGYRSIADNQRKQLADKGIIQYGDGGGSGPVTRGPATPKRPIIPTTSPDAYLKSLGIH